MKTKIKIILLYSMAILLLLFLATFIFRFLIDYGCSSPRFFFTKEIGTSSEKAASMSFLGVKCLLWNRAIQYNF